VNNTAAAIIRILYYCNTILLTGWRVSITVFLLFYTLCSASTAIYEKEVTKAWHAVHQHMRATNHYQPAWRSIMATDSLNEFSSFVNQQMVLIEDLYEHLSKASALMQLALHYDFSEFPPEIIHNYLWALGDIIQNAYTCSVHSLNATFAACRAVNVATASKSTLRK